MTLLTTDLSPEKLNPRGTYCVISDIQMRASIVVQGRDIIQGAQENRDFRRFEPLEPMWDNYVRVNFGKFVLGVWRDPTRPELHVQAASSVAPEMLTDPESAPEGVAEPPATEEEVHTLERAVETASARLATLVH